MNLKSCLAVIILFSSLIVPQTENGLSEDIKSLKKYNEALEHRLDILEKTIDDVLWFERLGDIAFIDKVRLTGPPRKKSNSNGCR